MDIINEIKRTFKEGSVLTRLIYINIAVFLFIKIAGVFFYLAGVPYFWINWLAVPSGLNELALKPWTPVTYMFLHAGFIHLLFNILGLYWFGKLFMYRFEGEKLLAVYILGGLAGAFLYVLSYNIFPGLRNTYGLLLGASASIFAILVAIAVYDPHQKIMVPLIGTFELKYVTAFYLLLSVIGISSSNPGGNIAHLGGALWGWFYIYQLRKGKDMGYGIVKLIDSVSKLFKPKNHMKVTYKQPPRDDYEYNRQKKYQQEEINRILDKIAKSGYESLSAKEKELLFKQGR